MLQSRKQGGFFVCFVFVEELAHNVQSVKM